MSQENVELVKAIFRGWDEAGVDGMLPFLHEDIEYLPIEERGSVHGHDALRRYFSAGWSLGRHSRSGRQSSSPRAIPCATAWRWMAGAEAAESMYE